MTVAQSNQQSRRIIAHHIRHQYKQRVADERYHHAATRIMRQPTLTQRLATLYARQYQSYAAQHEIRASATRDTHHLLAIDSQIVAQHAKAEAKGHHIDA